MNFAQNVLNLKVDKNSLAIFFVGQCGYIFKTPNGKLIGLDLYLSDCCERYFGFKRLSAKLFEPDEILFDYILASHDHYDHFDIDSMPSLISNKKTKLLTNKSGAKICEELKIAPEKFETLEMDMEYSFDDFAVKTVFCDHGDLCPDALGFLLKINNFKIYFAGDTAYRPEKIKYLKNENIDVMIAPINGAYGNLNADECAMYAEVVSPKLTIPCHFWTFAQHGGDPMRFINNMDNVNVINNINLMNNSETNLKYKLMAQGEYLILN